MTTRSAAGRTSTVTLDGNGRLATVQPPSGLDPSVFPAGLNPVTFHYDVHGRNDSITTGSHVLTFGFDATGYLSSITDPLGRVTSMTNDAVGRPTVSTEPDASQIQFSYDASSNVSSVTPPGKPAHLFSYDGEDQETLYTPPDVGTPMSTGTSYNLDRQVTLVSRPDGDFITPQYDPTNGRLQSISTAAGKTTFGYKTTTGQLQSIVAPGETLTYGYDGALLTSVAWSGSVSGSLSRTYDTSFRVASETVAGTTINYAYDNDDLLTQAGDLHIPRDPATGFVSSGTTLGTLQEASTYDAYGALQTYTVKKADGTLIYSVDYGTRDTLGRIVKKIETIQTERHTYDYGYDPNGRLVDVFNDGVAPGSTAWDANPAYPAGTRVSRNGVEYLALSDVAAGVQPELAPAIWQVTHAYAYDANGNRTMAPNLIGKPAPVYDAQDRMLSYGDCSYTYKNDGSLRSKTCPDGVSTYDYDAFGNLRHVGLPNGNPIDYFIDGQHRRVGKTVNGVMVDGFLYRTQLQPAAWLNADGTVRATFTYGLKANSPEYMTRNGTTYRIISDHSGSVRLVVNTSNGSVAERLDYDAFGAVVSDTSPGLVPFGFAGGLLETNNGLVKMGARDYDATAGRWLTKDVARFGGGRNFYEYARSDPTNRRDPTGLDPNDSDSYGCGLTISCECDQADGLCGGSSHLSHPADWTPYGAVNVSPGVVSIGVTVDGDGNVFLNPGIGFQTPGVSVTGGVADQAPYCAVPDRFNGSWAPTVSLGWWFGGNVPTGGGSVDAGFMTPGVALTWSASVYLFHIPGGNRR